MQEHAYPFLYEAMHFMSGTHFSFQFIIIISN